MTTNLWIRNLLPWETTNQRNRHKFLPISMITLCSVSSDLRSASSLLVGRKGICGVVLFLLRGTPVLCRTMPPIFTPKAQY